MCHKENLILESQKKIVIIAINLINQQFEKLQKYQIERIKDFFNNIKENNKIIFSDSYNLIKMDNEDEKSEGGIELLSLSGNLINDECINYFVEELMRYRWLRELKLNSNFISDDGGELILYAVLQNMNITKVNLENNQTTWEVNNENFKTFRDDIQIYF